MRFKWLLVTLLCVTLLHSAFVVRAQHEDYAEEDEEKTEVNEEVIETGVQDEPPPPVEDSEPAAPVADDPADPPEAEPAADYADEETEAEPAEEEPAINTDVEVDETPQKPIISSRRLGNYYFDEDYYSGNYDVDINYDWNPDNRVAPKEPKTTRHDGQSYVITAQRLAQIRSYFYYWYFDQGPNDDQKGDYQTDIHASNPQLHKNFNYQLPFFGFRFNYTRVSMHGYLEFSDPPPHYTYPLNFPIKDWPRRNDPSFIGIFFSKCRIGRIPPTDADQRTPGVYFRMERDLPTRTDRFGVEVRERTMWDIRTGVVGADTFLPKHVAIITWKNMSFAGGIDMSLYTTNSFQMVLATDEVYTYAIFNYGLLSWSAHTEAGGDTTGGEGGVPAFVGFNAGNGTQAYEYRPYSQASVIRDLTGRGWANGFPGRHIFRIDERIMLGTCNKDIDAANLPLVFAPESGNMLGGTIVNITGPCFEPNDRVSCRFDTEEVIGRYVDRNRVVCVQPFMLAQGYVRFEISVGTEKYKWKGRYFVETPATATDRIFFESNDVYQRAPSEVRITWNAMNLTTNANANVRISLFGYRESTIRPQLEYIDIIEESILNNGRHTIAPGNYRLRDNSRTNDMQFGFLMINLTNPESFNGLGLTPNLWSRPIPLGWYFGPQWERIHGRNWPRALCDNWLRTDRFLRNFPAQIPICPCTLEHALNDKGRFMPDFDCDRDANPTCLHHRGAIHCVRTGQPSLQGSEQQCCYDRNGNLMMSHDQMWGSRPRRTHNIGQMPWNEANKVPTLSTWFHDIRPFYSCCFWQDEQAVGCETLRFERRPTQDCVAYQAPAVAGIFGDPHIITFDNTQYTFNGLGEFVLVRANTERARLNVQGRFEQVQRNQWGPVMATQLTSVAMQGNTSTIIEVRLRPQHAQWRYRLDVFANKRRIYFDRASLKFQHFHGVTVYTPSYILNQSEVVVMFDSGAGIEVVENNGFMTARVYLPWTFINNTRGLFGNWSWDMADDFTQPDGTVQGINANNWDSIHRDFGLRWMLGDGERAHIGGSLFTHEFGRTSSSYSNSSFVPNFIREPRDFLPANRSFDVERAHELCADSYQCRYDFGMSVNREMAHFTKNYYDSIVNIRDRNSDHVISCGILPTPRFGRKSNFLFTPGSSVTFECNEGFMLIGDQRRTCTNEGRWDLPVYGYTECLREVFYTRRAAWITTGIILCVMIPLLMCIICGVYCYRKKELKSDPNYKLPIGNRSRSNSATIRYLPSDGSEIDGGTLKKSRSYDRVYRTNEPLEGKPNAMFPEKKWDLDDGDLTSSEGGAEKPPRQVGRRQMALDNEQVESPTEMRTFAGPMDGGYPPPPVDSPSPRSYSPSSSALDRNSFMTQPQQQQSAPQQFRPPSGAVRVIPGPSYTPQNSNNTNNPNDYPPFMSFSGPSSPQPPSQDVGLPKVNTKSTEV